MSVKSEIDRIITAVGNAYNKVSEKGGTVPASQTVANLATANRRAVRWYCSICHMSWLGTTSWR